MPFNQSAQSPNSSLSARHDGAHGWAIPVLLALGAVLVVAGAWLAPGFIFGTDWPGPRHFDLPDQVSSSAPLQVGLAAISWAFGPEATGKLLILAIFATCALTAYRASLSAGVAGKVAGSVLFTVNPFVFGRLQYGQLYLLAGYALLPWLASRLRLLCAEPGWKPALVFGLGLALVGVFSAHLFLAASVLASVAVLVHVGLAEDRTRYVRSLAAPLGAALATAGLLSSYWVVPLLAGRGADAAVIATTGPGLLRAYAAVPDPVFGLVPNLLGSYGFWAENAGRFTPMKALVPLWPAALIVILAVSALGAASAIRGKSPTLRPWVVTLLAVAAVTLLLEMGVSNPVTSPLVQWLDSTFPVYRGMRDAGKWAALLALVYSQLFGLGADQVLRWCRNLRLPRVQAGWVGATTAGLLIALPLYYGNGLLFGAHGGIKPSQYPAGWYAADRALASDPHPGRTLFLPWHEYMKLSFVQNQNSVIASPAPRFFSVPIVNSSDPELAGVPPPRDPDQVAISGLVRAGAAGDWAAVLARLGIKYVLVAREVDWQSYGYLDQQAGLLLIGDYGSIRLYRDIDSR